MGKKRKADSDLSEPEGSGEDEDSNPKLSKRGRKSKGGAIEEAAPSKEESPEAQTMPTVDQVCEQYGLNDVDLEYSDADYTNLTTYKLFQQNFRPRIQAENPKVPMSKLMMLVAAKWREFTALAPKEDEEAEEAQEQEEEDLEGSEEVRSEEAPQEEEEDEEEEAPLSKRKGGRGRSKKKAVEEEFLDFEDDSDEATPKRKARGGAAAKKKKGGKGKPAVPKLKIKLGGRKKKGSSDDEEEESDSDSEKESKSRARKEKNNDSDEEFEQMLKAAERAPPEEEEEVKIEKVKKPKGKAKMKIGNKNKKKGKKKKNYAEEEAEHQEYCEVCQQGGEIILCDTCPRAYHLCCLDPELDEAPEGKWSCPHCEINGPEIQDVDEEDEHMEFCRVCKEGGELLCCDSCPSCYHLKCCDPPLDEVPDGPWTCPRCACDPLPGKVEKILTWRWKEDDEPKEEEKEEEPQPGTSTMKPKKPLPKIEREFFIKLREQSYWHCMWAKEIQLDVFHPQTYRMYLRKNDMDEPPRFDEDGDDELMSKRLKHHKKAADPYKIQERFIRYGIRPDWLQIHHILSRRSLKDGTTQYFIRWRELPYVDCSWEDEDMDIPDFNTFIQHYEDLRFVCGADGSRRKKKKKKVSE